VLGESTPYEGSCSNNGRYGNRCRAGSDRVTGTLRDCAATAAARRRGRRRRRRRRRRRV